MWQLERVRSTNNQFHCLSTYLLSLDARFSSSHSFTCRIYYRRVVWSFVVKGNPPPPPSSLCVYSPPEKEKKSWFIFGTNKKKSKPGRRVSLLLDWQTRKGFLPTTLTRQQLSRERKVHTRSRLLIYIYIYIDYRPRADHWITFTSIPRISRVLLFYLHFVFSDTLPAISSHFQ